MPISRSFTVPARWTAVLSRVTCTVLTWPTSASRSAAAMPAGRCVSIEHDAYYFDQGHLPPDERANVNYDHPASLESALLAELLRQLRAGRAVDVPLYDFATHKRRAETRHVEPAPGVIVEGILVFVEAGQRDLMDIKVFVDTD